MKRQKGRRPDMPAQGQGVPSSPPLIAGAPSGLPQFLGQGGWLFAVLLIGTTLLAYLPALRGRFIWDDDSWTTRISGLLRSGAGLVSIWCQPTALQQYYPLTGTTFWLDYHLWGMWSLPYHLENVLLHALAALLFWKLLERLRVPGAWLAAAIFALHPVMVESAGWISERKNVLSLVFYLWALLAYGRFTRFWTGDNQPSKPDWRAYSLAFVLLLGALLAKTTAFSLPAVILLICWWRHGRIRWETDVLPTLPFFALSLGLCAVTAWLEKTHVGTRGPDFALTFPERCLVAGRAFWFYIGKLVWPADLCFVYPRWRLDAGSGWQWLYPVTAAGTGLAFWLGRRRIGRSPAAAVFFFVGTLFPVLGFMNAYFMRYSFVCDHWVYLSSLGLIALTGVAVVQLSVRLGQPLAVYGFAVVVLPLLAVGTWRQTGTFTNSETLWRTTMARNPSAWMAYDNLASLVLDRGLADDAMLYSRKALNVHPNDEIACVGIGNALLQKGQVDGAIANYQRALAILPDSVIAHYNLANALLQSGAADEAIAHYQEALKIQPDSAPAHNNLGSALLCAGRVDEAILQCQMALTIQPDDASTHDNLANALRQAGRVDEAVVHYERALAIQPGYAKAHNNLANVLVEKGRMDEAIKHYQMALATQPDYADAHNNLGIALFSRGQVSEAVAQWRAALRANPRHLLAQKNLAWVLATRPTGAVRNGAEAVALASQADQLSGGKDPAVLQTLAAAYAESGRFADAMATAQRALQLTSTQTDRSLADALRAQIGFYKAGLPFRDSDQIDIPVRSGPP